MSEMENEPGAFYGDDGHGGSGASAAEEAVDPAGGDAGANGNGAGRRRRRRRKHKGSPTVSVAQGGSESASIDMPAPLAAEHTGSEPGAQGGLANVQGGEAAPSIAPGGAQAPAQIHGQFGGGGKRKKRKRKGGGGGENTAQPSHAGGQGPGQRQRPGGGWKRREEGPDGNREGARGGFGSEHFGGNGNSNGGRRRGKAGGFVGPMDHSYRMANGNVADRSPQGGQRMVNGNLRRFDDVEFEPIAVIREDAPARIICFIEDLFVVTKMQETARKMGVKVQFAKANKETLAAITEAPEGERASLIVFDLNNAAAKPLTVIPKLKAKLKRGTSIIGFLQQIQGDLKVKAMEAGCDSVMPKAAFSQNVPNLLRRHGAAEAEELAEA